ncbi:AAA family ATPase [Paenibacillus sp. Dod16]|uniref:AAA family ATPase n=1 Tax=Paenibacillus sp. Dod16 TaxID=3416392 RepID=UPI003CF3491A
MSRIKYLHETNRNIIITGIPRSGKSTVAFEISKKLNYSLVQLDPIVEAMKKAFPNIKLEKNPVGILEYNEFNPFLIEYLKELNDDVPRKKGINYVIEGSDLDLNEYFKHFSKDDFIVVGICYPNRNEEEIYANMKKYDNILDWSYYLSDIELRNYAEALYRRNKELEGLLKKYNITYYDVSRDRNSVLQQIESDMISFVKGTNSNLL